MSKVVLVTLSYMGGKIVLLFQARVSISFPKLSKERWEAQQEVGGSRTGRTLLVLEKFCAR